MELINSAYNYAVDLIILSVRQLAYGPGFMREISIWIILQTLNARRIYCNDDEKEMYYIPIRLSISVLRIARGCVLCGNSGYRHLPDLLRFAVADSILTYCRWHPSTIARARWPYYRSYFYVDMHLRRTDISGIPAIFERRGAFEKFSNREN